MLQPAFRAYVNTVIDAREIVIKEAKEQNMTLSGENITAIIQLSYLHAISDKLERIAKKLEHTKQWQGGPR